MSTFDANNPRSLGDEGSLSGDQIEETIELIAASKVNGTAVYNLQGDKLGSIHDLMIDKINGDVRYAVLSFGGFLGIGEKYHPLPWDSLVYDQGLGGYHIAVSNDRLRAAPSYSEAELGDFTAAGYDRAVSDYYDRA